MHTTTSDSLSFTGNAPTSKRVLVVPVAAFLEQQTKDFITDKHEYLDLYDQLRHQRKTSRKLDQLDSSHTLVKDILNQTISIIETCQEKICEIENMHHKQSFILSQELDIMSSHIYSKNCFLSDLVTNNYQLKDVVSKIKNEIKDIKHKIGVGNRIWKMYQERNIELRKDLAKDKVNIVKVTPTYLKINEILKNKKKIHEELQKTNCDIQTTSFENSNFLQKLSKNLPVLEDQLDLLNGEFFIKKRVSLKLCRDLKCAFDGSYTNLEEEECMKTEISNIKSKISDQIQKNYYLESRIETENQLSLQIITQNVECEKDKQNSAYIYSSKKENWKILKEKEIKIDSQIQETVRLLFSAQRDLSDQKIFLQFTKMQNKEKVAQREEEINKYQMFIDDLKSINKKILSDIRLSKAKAESFEKRKCRLSKQRI